MDGVEAIWVQVRVNQRKLLVGGIYRPPKANNAQWLNMEHCLDHVFNSACDNILVNGDFNVNIEAPSNKMSRRIILHTRLRLCCSSLNYDLYRHNLVESHHCDYGAVETPTHILLSCPLFQNTWLTYLSNLPSPLTSEFLLHGDDRLSDDINISICFSVQKYIRATQRFSTC